jgi:VanZ family protein
MNNFLKIIFYFLLISLMIVSIYPGSLLGYLLYGDSKRELVIHGNILGNSINHFLCYFHISLLGFIVYLKKANFQNCLNSLFLLSIILEMAHLFIPNRSFQIVDLAGNMLGVIVAYSLVKIYLLFNKL